jgi:hypothetical protein
MNAKLFGVKLRETGLLEDVKGLGELCWNRYYVDVFFSFLVEVFFNQGVLNA